MGYEGSWSGMRKWLEKEMLADSLQGRIRYGCTTYPEMDNCRIFEICVDNKTIKQFSWATVNSYFVANGCKPIQNPHGQIEYWDEFWSTLEQYPISQRTEYTDREFCDALAQYRKQDIAGSLQCENPIVRMFAILDRRVGKRSLAKLQADLHTQPEWLQAFYRLRADAEKSNS